MSKVAKTSILSRGVFGGKFLHPNYPIFVKTAVSRHDFTSQIASKSISEDLNFLGPRQHFIQLPLQSQNP